jgi:hypothetical protein
MKIKPGMELLIPLETGIANIPLIVKSVADEIKREAQNRLSFLQWEAMSGATAEGKWRY